MHGKNTLDLYLVPDVDSKKSNDEEISLELESSFSGPVGML